MCVVDPSFMVPSDIIHSLLPYQWAVKRPAPENVDLVQEAAATDRQQQEVSQGKP
jgi:hypothetical protein